MNAKGAERPKEKEKINRNERVTIETVRVEGRVAARFRGDEADKHVTLFNPLPNVHLVIHSGRCRVIDMNMKNDIVNEHDKATGTEKGTGQKEKEKDRTKR